MTAPGDGGRWHRRLGTHLLLIMILITLPVIGLITALDYREVEETLIAGEDSFRKQTEESIILSMHLVDTGLKIFDKTLDSRVVEGFDLFVMEYERAGRNPAAMDLARLQEDLGEEMDIYIINEIGRAHV